MGGVVVSAREGWEERAACGAEGVDAESFFPPPAPSRRGAHYTQARGICAGCPVILECLNYALHHRIAFGMWGGRSPGERKVLLRLAWSE